MKFRIERCDICGSPFHKSQEEFNYAREYLSWMLFVGVPILVVVVVGFALLVSLH